MLNVNQGSEHGSSARLRHLPVQRVSTEDGVILARGCEEFKVAGRGADEAVCLILNTAGTRGATREAILSRFAGPDREHAEALVDKLVARRILVPADGDDNGHLADGQPESALEVFYWHFGLRQEEAADRLSRRQICILGVNAISRRLAEALRAVEARHVEVVDYPLLRNIRLFEEDRLRSDAWPAHLPQPAAYDAWGERMETQTPDCLVAACDFGGQPVLREWNEFCVQQKITFLPVWLDRMVGYVGPLVIPGETPCFECLRARENANASDPETLRLTETTAGDRQPVIGFHPSMASILGDIAAVELTRLYSEMMPWEGGRHIEVRMLVPETITRRLLKVPRCRVCSPLNRRSAVSVTKLMLLQGDALSKACFAGEEAPAS